MRMENRLSSDMIPSKNKPQDSDYVNHATVNEKTSSSEDVNASKSSRDCCKQNWNPELENDKKSSTNENHLLVNLNSNDDERNGNVNSMNILPNDASKNADNHANIENSLTSNNIGDNCSHDALDVDSSRHDSTLTVDKNKPITSCDTIDHLSATETDEVTETNSKEDEDHQFRNGDLNSNNNEILNSNELSVGESDTYETELSNRITADQENNFESAVCNSTDDLIEIRTSDAEQNSNRSEPMEVDCSPQATDNEENDQFTEKADDNDNNGISDENYALQKEKDHAIMKDSTEPENSQIDATNSKKEFSETTKVADTRDVDAKTANMPDAKCTEKSIDLRAWKDASVEESQSKNTEVLHIDENDDDTEEVMDTAECDPFAQESENVANEVEEMEVDGNNKHKSNVEAVPEVNLIDENQTNDSTSKTSQEKESTANEESTDQNDHCIIPDSMSGEPPKIAIQPKPKFDITPVRLEKLMDPSKLANSQERSIESSSDSEASTVAVTSRPQRRAAKKAESQIKEIVAQSEGEHPFGNIEDVEQLSEASVQVCYRCGRLRSCKYVASLSSKTIYLCQDNCLGTSNEKKVTPIKCTSKLQIISHQKPVSSIPDSIHFLRKCSQCGLHNIADEKSLTWEAMDFCNEDCLGRYQTQNGAFCAFCKGNVQHTSMGKYSVRFGLEARQFCSGTCLEEFKKGLKSCSYCQQDITKSTNIVSAQIGDKAQSKDFCSESCVEKYERMSASLPLPVVQDLCTVCAQKKDVEVQVLIQTKTHSLCSDVCFMTFKFANNISDIDQCHICKKYYEDQNLGSHFVFHDDVPYNFCSKICMNVFILFKRKIVPCSWCKVKKYNFDMIKKITPNGSCVMMCSLNCLTLYQVSINATSSRKIKCDLCSNVNYAQYHLTMSDATIRNFCSYNCVMIFQAQYNKTPLTVLDHNKSNLPPVPLGGPKRTIFQPQKVVVSQTNDIRSATIQKSSTTVANGLLPQFTAGTAALKISSPLTVATATGTNLPPLTTAATKPLPPKYIQQIIVRPPEPKDVANKFTQCRPSTVTKSTSCRPTLESTETQTDDTMNYPAIVPIPVPIYVPTPMHMFTTPFPVPVPFPLPIPVPIFIPTSKNTYKQIVQYMKEIVDKTPTNPYEADLLLMAKMVAGEEKPEESEEVTKNDSGEDDDMHFADAAPDLSDTENFADAESAVSNNFTDDVLQMALKMATEQLSNSPTVDLEAELTSNTITPQTQTEDTAIAAEVTEVPVETRPTRTRKRTNKTSSDAPSRKRGRQQNTAQGETDSYSTVLSQPSSDMSSPPLIPEGERPDANMCLKYTIGIRAWKQWVLTKNDQIEQAAVAANKKAKTFNTNILKLTTDELNYLLCLFVKEVRKPNGVEYAPDTIYYLCLSIQQYLFENGRIDNIFTDSFYEPFTNALDEVAKKFSEVNDATQYIVTRVEEEHLWESKQLGAHSPHVLLATLMFFNTKYFNLATLEEHMQLSFSHIMKHWKRNPNTPIGKPGSPAPNRNVVLRFYPPQAALDAPNSRKKKVYEQHENEVNPLRCPVKLYEFYLSKCPESVKQRNDVFYLQPERSCVPDSPVWYSTMPLQKELLMKMLHRIRMVKEVNISLLAS